MIKKNNRTNKTLKAMTGSAFLIAISIILTRFLAPCLAIGGANSLRIGLGTVPIMIGSVIFGPVYGAIIGGSADLIGALCFPSGAYNLGFTISSLLQGVFPYYVIKLLTGKPKLRMVVSSVLLSILVLTNISFFIDHDSYKFTSSFTLTFNETTKFLFMLGLIALYSTVLISYYFISKKLKNRNEKAALRYDDAFIFCLFNETIINVLISSVWKMFYFKLDYVAMTFSASILLLFDVPVKSTIIFLLLIPVYKIYPNWEVKSKNIITVKDLEKHTKLLDD